MRTRPPTLVLEHEPDDPPGLLADWLGARGLPWELRRLEDGLPDDPTAYAAVITLGSASSVNDDDPWIARELDFVRRAHAADVPLLGLCFGAQLLSKACGGEVSRSPEEEFGWIRARPAPGGWRRPGDAVDPITAPTWFCWHDDAFTLPPGATLLAESPVCVQAFQLGRSVGTQFHPEVDEDTIDLWIQMRAEPNRKPIDLGPAVAGKPHFVPGLRERAFAFFDEWLRRTDPARAG